MTTINALTSVDAKQRLIDEITPEFHRMTAQSPRLALVLHPVGRKYKARHRRVAS